MGLFFWVYTQVKTTIEKQAEIIRQQRAELESLRRHMEKSVTLQQDFQSELSEIRKNWQMISNGGSDSQPNSSNGPGDKGNKSAAAESTDTVINKLEMLATAYNDIQDRLYEIDKSWKNNLMIYGVAYSEAEEDDPVLTEVKVRTCCSIH